MDENDKVVSQEQEYKYSFKFVDHAPFVFKYIYTDSLYFNLILYSNIRSAFGFDTADYLETLTKDLSLYELQSPGKSGAFFYFSLDYKFIIKTVTETEAEFFKTFLQNYYQVCHSFFALSLIYLVFNEQSKYIVSQVFWILYGST